jgi:hypothetical protein
VAERYKKLGSFRIWSICLLIVVLSASIVFVIRVGRTPSEPFVSVDLISRRTIPRGGEFADLEVIGLQVNNRMSFNAMYWIGSQVFDSNKWVTVRRGGFAGPLTPHSLTNVFLFPPPEGARLVLVYERQHKPFEQSILNKLPWLKQHYPFNIRHFAICDYHGGNTKFIKMNLE